MARIGTDEWVATVEGRTAVHGGWLGQLREAWERVHPGYQLAAFAIIAAIFPFLTDSDFVLRVGVNVLLFAILAVGLNVTVGWTGMLDLSFVAFYGFGAYAYAFMSSNQFDLHWPTEAVIIIAVIAAGFLGLLLGLPSWRLVGDYLAIITLFFAQMFVEIMNNLDRISVPWRDEPLSITGGPNGITRLDDFTLFGIDFSTLNHYFYFLLIALILVVVGFHGINQSRTGRAWRAIREDPLAAEAMSVPINRLRILAFTFGAATAGLAGSVFAAVQTGVFPQSFEVVLLIMIYAALVLGGTGSIKGAILGAIVIASIPQVLRPTAVDSASWLVYISLATGLVLFLRPWWKAAGVVVATVAFGFIVRAIGVGFWPDSIVDEPLRASNLAEGVTGWVLVRDTNSDTVGNVAFVLLILAVLSLVQLRGRWRTAMIVPTIYLAVFTWENRLSDQPSITRQLIFGAMLIVLMATRPQGLLGTRRVEVT